MPKWTGLQWVKIVSGYQYFTDDRGFEANQRRAVLDVITLFSINGPAVVDIVSTSPEMRENVQAIVDDCLPAAFSAYAGKALPSF